MSDPNLSILIWSVADLLLVLLVIGPFDWLRVVLLGPRGDILLMELGQRERLLTPAGFVRGFEHGMHRGADVERRGLRFHQPIAWTGSRLREASDVGVAPSLDGEAMSRNEIGSETTRSEQDKAGVWHPVWHPAIIFRSTCDDMGDVAIAFSTFASLDSRVTET